MTAYVALPGSTLRVLPNSRPAGEVNRSQIDSITIRVRPRGDVAEPDLDLVEQFAQRHNLVVVNRNGMDRSIMLKGTLGDLLNAFPADLNLYHHACGTYRGRRGEIRIPRELAGIVTGIFGLDTRPDRLS